MSSNVEHLRHVTQCSIPGYWKQYLANDNASSLWCCLSLLTCHSARCLDFMMRLVFKANALTSLGVHLYKQSTSASASSINSRSRGNDSIDARLCWCQGLSKWCQELSLQAFYCSHLMFRACPWANRSRQNAVHPYSINQHAKRTGKKTSWHVSCWNFFCSNLLYTVR